MKMLFRQGEAIADKITGLYIKKNVKIKKLS